MEWLNRLSNAIEYMEEHLAEEISYEEAAKIACCSTFYFQRMFSYVAGISLSEYIRRRRMTQAAFELQNTDRKVIDIAMKYGYTSASSFNRAFHSIHGASPIVARQSRCNLNSYPPIRFSVNVIGGEAMSYRVVEKESMRVVGVRTPLLPDMEENQRMVPLFWEDIRKSNQFTELHEHN
ncbi:MAG TPA: AraC family transcriptional regulator, partial [Lachnospiraceae bacterium]|nr:AraC family transcriptional regulator [Lachnospiraceae bacterium]